MSPPSDRILWIDHAKGIGITLVVIGHALRGLVSAGVLGRTTVVVALDDWIYAFHMPLFFFLAGLLLRPALSRPFGHFAADKLRTVAYPYVLWALLQESLRVVLSGHTNLAGEWTDLMAILHRPPAQFWFLYVLLLILITCRLLKAARIPLGVIAAMGAVGFAVSVLLPASWPPLNLALHNGLFVSAGLLAGGPDLRGLTLSAGRSAAAAAAGFVVLGAAILVGSPLPWLVPVWAGAGIAMALGLAQYLEHRGSAIWLASLGRLSLQIYVAHTLASAGARIVLQQLRVTDPACHILLGVAAGIAGPLFLAATAQRLAMSALFVLPGRRRGSSTGGWATASVRPAPVRAGQ